MTPANQQRNNGGDMLDDDLVELIYGDFAESATTANGERSMIDSVHIEEIITMVRADERERYIQIIESIPYDMIQKQRIIKAIKAKYGVDVKSKHSWNDLPIGTKVYDLGGGHWIKTERGYKWFNGSTFPTPGGSWVKIELPKIEKPHPKTGL